MIDLDELERLCREATPGPWETQPAHLDEDLLTVVYYGEDKSEYWIADEVGGRAKGENYEDNSECISNAELIAALRNAAPKLIAISRRYQELRRHVCIVGTEKCAEFHVVNIRPTYIAPDAAIELDAVLDAMREQEQKR